MKISILYLLCWVQIIIARECFLTCGAFDNCNSPRCAGNCGNDESLSRISFIIDTCDSDDDLCVYREVVMTIEGKSISTVIPGGCLLKYEHSEKDDVHFTLSKGTNLFACEDDFCNVPALESCTESAVKAMRTGRCFLKGNDDIEEIFAPFSPIRAGNFQQESDRRTFCVIDDDDFEQYSPDSSCFGSHVGDTTIESRCTSLDQLQEIDYVECEDCFETPSCDPTNANPGPETLKPTKSPSNAPTEEIKTPTANPTDETENPTISPPKETDSPTKNPIAQETQSPSFFRLNPSQAPIIESTSSPSISVKHESIFDSLAFLIGLVISVSLCTFFGSGTVVLCLSEKSSTRNDKKKDFYIDGERVHVVDPVFVSRQADVESDETDKSSSPGLTFLEFLDDVVVKKEQDRYSNNTQNISSNLETNILNL